MNTTSMVSLAMAIVFTVLYVLRRRNRLAREDQD
jgi:uncharacterized membrane protein